MRKVIKSSLIIIVALLICCSCGKKEYKLIELTSNELLNHLLTENSNITFITYNADLDNNQEFIANVEKICKLARENIYYIDTNHISSSDNLFLYEIMGDTIKKLRYYVYQNGQFIIQNDYSDYETMLKDLNGKKYKEEPTLTDDETKKAYIQRAELAYEEGKISSAYDLLNMAWNLDEAKKFYDKSNYFNIVDEWESYEVIDNGKTLVYTKIMIYSFSDIMYIATKTGNIDGFIKPSVDEYKSYYYYIKDDNIYLKDTDGDKYKKTYSIDYLSDEYLTITKDNKTYKFFALKEE